MTKITPPMEFNEVLVAGNGTAALKEAGATRGNAFNLDIEEIAVLPDFNPRVSGTKDYDQHIDDLAHSILVNGFLPGKPLTVFPAEEVQEDGSNITVFYVVDGHSRLAAVRRANEQGAGIEMVPVAISPPGTTLADLTVQTVLNNNSTKPLSPFEMAIVVKRLLGYNMSNADVAKRLNITERYVSHLLVLAGAPASVQEAVRAGKISASLAVAELQQHGAKAPERIQTAVAALSGKGKAKVTPKSMPKTPVKPADRKKAVAKVERAAKGKTPAKKPAPKKAETPVVSGQPATDVDFYREAIVYALAVPKKGGLDWLAAFMGDDAAAVGELEAWMGQPAGAFFDATLRVPVDKEGI